MDPPSGGGSFSVARQLLKAGANPCPAGALHALPVLLDTLIVNYQPNKEEACVQMIGDLVRAGADPMALCPISGRRPMEWPQRHGN